MLLVSRHTGGRRDIVSHFAVSAVGGDRPGIVAAVTRVLFEQGCNLEDTEMSVLRGHFAMMLVVSGPDGLMAEELERALAGAASGGPGGLVVAVRAIDDPVPTSPVGEPWSVSVYGADRPGIVHAVTSVLASAGVNIVGLETRVIGDLDRPVYAMLLDVTVPADVDGDTLAVRLAEDAADVGVECTMRRAEADIL
jgi:glycine cleavage system transcriptional repressor